MTLDILICTIDDIKILKHNLEMAEHANGTALFLCSLIGGQYVTKEQTREAMDFLLAATKRNIESNPNASNKKKMQRFIEGSCL